MTKKHPILLPCLLLLMLAVTFSGNASSVRAKGLVTLFAAASVAPVLQEISKVYSSETGVKVRISAAASSVLARQVASGAPADIVVLANTDWMQWLQDHKLIVGTSRHDLISNRLVLLRHKDVSLPVDIEKAINLAIKKGRIAMADPDHVPAGIYGKSALKSLGLWKITAPALARSANAPAAVALLARGEVSAAISYQTDARLSDKVVVHAVFPASGHAPVRYQIAMASTTTGSLAGHFFSYLRHPDRLGKFRAAGFTAALPPRRK